MAEYGFSREKFHFVVVLEPDGTLVSLDDIRDRNDKGKPIPRLDARPRRRGPFRDRPEALLLLGQYGLCPGTR